MEPSDRELMARLAAGDRDALDPLMERHHRRLYRIALGYLRDPDLALDAVQETFVKAFQNASRWDARAEVAPWLVRIAVNQSIDRTAASAAAAPPRSRWPRGDQSATLAVDDAVARPPGAGPRDRRAHPGRARSACPTASARSSCCGTARR